MVKRRIGIVGGGPAGLMAAETASELGAEVHVFDSMPSVGRKFLMAGKSGLNITHAEDHASLRSRYGEAIDRLGTALDEFDGAAVRAWAQDLGIETYVGSSGRVFPTMMKASPLLRAWLKRLGEQGVSFHTRHRLVGLADRTLVFETPDGTVEDRFDAVVLALGGASWPRLGSDARWVSMLAEAGVEMAPFQPANCGFEVSWSAVFSERFAGQPIKSVVATSDAGAIPGEFVVTRWGVEGSLVYAHAAALRDRLAREGAASLTLDLVPGRSLERLARDLMKQPAKTSFSNRMRKGAGLDGVKLGLVRELIPDAASLDASRLAEQLKSIALPLASPRAMEEAISVAGGIKWESVERNLMLRALPGVFIAGEMLDWEAPTGGYLLTACFATGRVAGRAAAGF